MSKPQTALIAETPWQRLDRAFRTVLKVSKEDILKREAEEKQPKRKGKLV